MNLNPKQEEAKNKVDGPLLIIAGAGSGKTATLTARVEYMIRERDIIPSSILMVTFTNKAAKEMRERVANTLGVEAGNNMYKNMSRLPLIGTFHSIGIFILKELLGKYDSEELNIGLKKDFVIYDESDKLSVLKSILKNDLHMDEKEFPARQVAFYISNAKNALISAKNYEKEIDSKIKEVVFQVYIRYEENLRQNNALDFDDILLKVLGVLQIPKVLDVYQERYRYLMVDEYQDTNAPQYQIVKLLAGKYRNIAVVGDDSQSIYSWRGANMNNILHFKKDYSDALIVKLEQNYRSTKHIIAGANSVIDKNTTGIKKELWTDKEHGEKINYIEAPDDKTEAMIIASIIKEYSDLPPTPSEGRGAEKGETEKEHKYNDNLILYRTNAQSRQIEEALMMKNIPYRVIGGMKFYDRKEIKDLLAYLRVIHNPADIVSMKRVINTPTRKIGAKSIEILDNYRENFALPYIQIIANIDEVEELRGGAKEALRGFGELLKELIECSKQKVVSEVLSELIKKTKYDEYISEGLSSDESQAKKDNIDELITVASQYNGMEPRESLAQFLEEVALITDMDTKDERSDYVTLMTIHTSKGLEQKNVFVTGIEENIFPSFRSINDPHALEEERRLMYVAMTRAKENLYLSRAGERFHFGEYVRNRESRFLGEIDSIYMESYDISQLDLGNHSFFGSFKKQDSFQETTSPIIKKSRIQENDVSQFSLGERVEHPKFGNGIITSLNGELAEIAFAGVGVKKMNIRIAPVRRLNSV